RFGDGSGPPVHVVIKSHAAERAIMLNPWLAVPEAYMNGEFEFAEGDILELLRQVYQNDRLEAGWLKAIDGMRIALRRLHQMNTASRSRRNVAHHYDLSREFYELFLDEDM